ncbi:MAG: hypothetical protein ACKVJN_00075 [Woeseiales bacterium]
MIRIPIQWLTLYVLIAAPFIALAQTPQQLNLGRLDHDSADVEALRAEGVTFMKNILPMIEEKCYRCHSYRADALAQ